MLDVMYEDLLAIYFDACHRHEKAVDELIDHARNGRRAEFNSVARHAKLLVGELDRAYLELIARRQVLEQR